MQDVPYFLQRKNLEFRGYLDPTRPALMDSAHVVRVNYETYLFADTFGRETFRADPVRYCGLVTDPVSRARFRPEPDAPRTTHERVLYVFESAANLETFESEPDLYRLPGFAMGNMGERVLREQTPEEFMSEDSEEAEAAAEAEEESVSED